MRQQRAGSREGIGAARADGDDAVLRLDHITGAADDQRGFAVGYRQQCFELAEAALGAPILCQLHRRAGQLAVLFELGFKQLEQSEGVRSRAGKASQHLAIAAKPAHLARVALHHRVPQRDLAVTGNRHMLAATHAADGGGMKYVRVLTGVHTASGILFNGNGDRDGRDQACPCPARHSHRSETHTPVVPSHARQGLSGNTPSTHANLVRVGIPLTHPATPAPNSTT
ncbi:hypothetical protein D3C71_1389300 [compost metagenome]